MSTAPLPHDGAIDPARLYQLAVARALLGWGVHAMRQARRNGLTVRYVSKRGYVLGEDIIKFVREHGTTSNRPTT